MGFIRGILLWLIAITCVPAYPLTVSQFDFDGTLVSSRRYQKGTFITPIRLFRKERRLNILQLAQDDSELPEYVDVTPVEYENMEEFLGVFNGKFGATGKKFNLEDGRVIRPGYYELRGELSFPFFGEALPGQNYLLTNIKEAISREPKHSWKGPAYFAFQALLANPQTSRWTGIMSARRHRREEWVEAFDYLKSINESIGSPDPALINGVSRSEFDRFETRLHGDDTKRKSELLREMAIQLGRVRLTENDLKLDPDGRTRQRLHTLIFAEDKQETIRKAIREFQRLAQGRIVPVKFVIINTGSQLEVRESRCPRVFVIRWDGICRPATPDELIGEPTELTNEQRGFVDQMRQVLFSGKAPQSRSCDETLFAQEEK